MLTPGDAAAAAVMLSEAVRDRRTVRPRGSGSKIGWTDRAQPAGAEMSLLGLDRPVAHYAGDLVATIPAGMTLAAANAVLSRSGQWLPLDPAFGDRATIGGIVAANDSGPRRYRYGSPRDLIIGIEVALADGRVAKAGGRVVKNVAGYDLSRLFCGSFGSLGVITGATFKLAPRTPASRTVVAEIGDPRRAVELALTLTTQPLTPSAIELEAPGSRLLVRFESTDHAATEMSVVAKAVLREGGARAFVLSGDDEQRTWDDYESRIWTTGGVTLKVSMLPTDLAALFVGLDESDPAIRWRCSGRAALGVMILTLDGPDGLLAHTVTRLVQLIRERRGHATLLNGPASMHALVNASGTTSANSALRTLMESVKQRFDPHGVLPPIPGYGPGAS